MEDRVKHLRATALWDGVVTGRDAKHRRVLNMFFGTVYTYEEATEAVARLFAVADVEGLSVRMLLAQALKDSRSTDEGWASLDTDMVFDLLSEEALMRRLTAIVFDLLSEKDVCHLASLQWVSATDVVDTLIRATDIGTHDTFAV
jgi:hypothetical protein